MAKQLQRRVNVIEMREMREQGKEVPLAGKSVSYLPAEHIRATQDTQMRVEINQEVVTEYANVMLEAGGWGPFPPIEVYFDGFVYWLGDGFHRIAGFERANLAYDHQVPAEVKEGTRRDAILCAVRANAAHGLRRTQADKRRAVETLLQDPEWGQWSDREIARQCKVSPDTVGRIRAELQTSLSESDSEKPAERTYTTKHGTVATMRVQGQREAAKERRSTRLVDILATPPESAADLPAMTEQDLWEDEHIAPAAPPEDRAVAGYGRATQAAQVGVESMPVVVIPESASFAPEPIVPALSPERLKAAIQVLRDAFKVCETLSAAYPELGFENTQFKLKQQIAELEALLPFEPTYPPTE
jgi:hypothetical protein